MLNNKQIVMENFLIDSEKLTEICRYFGLNLANFAAKNDLKTQELYAISGGKQKEFSRQTLVGIAKHCPELSLYWLITGEGSMLAGSANHHNAVASDHSTATVTHAENGDLTSIVASQQATIAKQADTIATLAAKI